ncbi:unnamed protein product [Caenorhabditis sp. 36 PRJEB53466]|nr:unnamed protein product [Caenorhabditis sp. 36 PRJEB53466]
MTPRSDPVFTDLTNFPVESSLYYTPDSVNLTNSSILWENYYKSLSEFQHSWAYHAPPATHFLPTPSGSPYSAATSPSFPSPPVTYAPISPAPTPSGPVLPDTILERPIKSCTHCGSIESKKWKNVRTNMICLTCFVYERKYKKQRPLDAINKYNARKVQKERGAQDTLSMRNIKNVTKLNHSTTVYIQIRVQLNSVFNLFLVFIPVIHCIGNIKRMDNDSSDRNGKPPTNGSAEELKEKNPSLKKGKSAELPAHLRPKFTMKNRRPGKKKKISTKSCSKESSREEEVSAKSPAPEAEKIEDEDDKPSVEKMEEEGEVVKVELEKEKEKEKEREKEKEKEKEEEEQKEPVAGDFEQKPPEQNSDRENSKAERKKIVKVEKEKSAMNVMAKFVDDKSEEKRKKEKEKEKAQTLNFWEKTEKKREEERRKTEGSKRKKSNRKKESPRKQPSKRRKKVKKDATNSVHHPLSNTERSADSAPPPAPTQSPGLPTTQSAQQGTKTAPKKEKPKAENVKMVNTTKTQKKKPSFFKAIIDKTKFWMRKSDCVAQPTKEMLSKSIIPPDYDPNNPLDFAPDPHFLFPSEDDWKKRLKNNCSSREEIFINFRPFWINKTNEDVLPKSRLLVQSQLLAQYHANNSMFLKELPKRTFYDPLKEPLEKLQAVDKLIGVDPAEMAKKNQIDRITSNTFYATLHLQMYRESAEGKKKMEDCKRKLSIAGAKEQRSTNTEEKKSSQPKLSWNIPEKYLLNIYNRKDRPLPGGSRKWLQSEYVAGMVKKPAKKGDRQPKVENKKA